MEISNIIIIDLLCFFCLITSILECDMAFIEALKTILCYRNLKI